MSVEYKGEIQVVCYEEICKIKRIQAKEEDMHADSIIKDKDIGSKHCRASKLRDDANLAGKWECCAG